MTTANLETATKQELRILCKSAAIKNYGKMSNDQMRAALKAHAESKTEPTAKKPKKGAPAAKRGDQQSIREWLAEKLKKGPLPVADAIAYAEKTKRSKVTIYRMAAVCGARAEKGVFVPAQS